MSMADGQPRQEIVIVRRGGGDHEDGHHGGAWKIAFADFMTAMMCFFLVMWLINAANEQTKAAVASYFNPVKLIDRNSSKKGLEDMGDGPHAAGMAEEDPAPPTNKGGDDGRGNAGPATEADASEQVEEPIPSDEALFANPYAVLSEIVNETGTMQNISEKGDGGAQAAGPATGASGGESYRDPFAPEFWSEQMAALEAAETAASQTRREPEAPAHEETGPLADVSPLQDAAGQEAEAATAEKATPAPAERTAAESGSESAGKPAAEKDEGPSAEALAAAKDIRQALNEAFGPSDKLGDGLSVVATEKGVSISVTDQLDFGMFEIGSAMPRREMILAMEKISRIIAERPGKVSIAGHTDGRPFRSRNYDNWRLSGARAQSAYYMLVRAGLDEKRVQEVSGFADRVLKDAADPFSATNRRIEITLEVEG